MHIVNYRAKPILHYNIMVSVHPKRIWKPCDISLRKTIQEAAEWIISTLVSYVEEYARGHWSSLMKMKFRCLRQDYDDYTTMSLFVQYADDDEEHMDYVIYPVYAHPDTQHQTSFLTNLLRI